ncbi:hypothetical protein AQUCO_01100286v1 [Aquilegia coerulea]|uniref:Uncharacterized protein n=1 Tax=Aquilegia coerulea TaxID=218851 RepID=A0A2G5E6F9_AQUCA|nr:hypothetical protein AQUCO_01100286v1 [Aquilegia coerulea]
MEISLRFLNVGCSLLFLIWLLVEVVRERRYVEDEELKQTNSNNKQRKTRVFIKITLLSNILISLSYLGFCVYKFWKLKTLSIDLVFKGVTWFLVSLSTFYFKSRTSREDKRWPLVMVLWCHAKEIQELEQPLLHEEEIPNNDFRSFSKAGVWSQITFRWLNPLFEIGRAGELELSHIPQVPDSETAEKAYALLQESLAYKTETFSLPGAIICAIWRPLALNAVFAGINTIASYLGPFLITNFVNFLSGKQDDSSHSYGLSLALLLFLAKTVESLSQRQWYFGAYRIGIRVRAALLVSIYKKTVKTKNFGPTTGKIVNFINVDVERIGDFCFHIHGIWLLPVQIFLAVVILNRNLGWAPSIAAVFATVVVMVSNTPLAGLQEKFHSKIMEAKDARIKSTSETLKSMRVLKLHSWETSHLKNILKLRENERSWLKKYLYLCAGIAFLFWTSPTLVSVTTFGVCILVKTPLTSGTVLSALATFRILQEPIYNLPELISIIAQTKVSIDRLQDFIREEDQKTPASSYTPKPFSVAIEIRSGEYTWDRGNPFLNKPTIKITKNIKIMQGSKIAVCGTVGSGKSSFLSSILDEIPRISGLGIKVYGSKAYVAQSAWIQTGTIRENVLFGKEMDKGLYEEVLKACALNRDIDMWADGDWSVLGERGMNLSGGQKQRIQLARAIYSDADVYLLDDPFSAVDAHTGAHLFRECLMCVLSEKTVMYVTHQLEFLDASDLVLVIKDGKIVQSGKYEELIADAEGELVKQMAAHSQSLSQVTPHQDDKILISGLQKRNQCELIEEISDNKYENVTMSDNNNEEVTETGRVKWRVYSTFLSSAYKGALVPVILLCHVLFQGLQISSNYWIAWATEEEGKVSEKQLIGIFVLLSVGSSIFILGRAVLLSTIAIESAQRLFLGMINSIFRAKISFFDSTPSSQILNRSSTDQSTVDTDIPYRLAGLAFALIQLLSIMVLMSHVAWQIFLLFLVILAISVWYQTYYINTARELARMKETRKSPILHHFSESIAGASTIRCFNQETRFLEKSQNLIDDYSRLTFHSFATMEWLCVRINFLFNLVFLFMLIVLVTLPRTAIDPSMAGLAATYGLSLHVLQAWVIWNLCNVENKMISVERILQFSNIPSEPPLEIEGCIPHPDWPTNGTINIENLHVQYSPSLPMILKGITCKIPGKKKIGVVGRTGSGKSTLIQALFRVVEPSDGRILIDGVDIGKMGLQDLRSRLSIIPQDPTLFQGTIRTNLDPLMQHSDFDIWEVLNKCHLGKIVRQDQRLLDAPVAEDGQNWSVGQRQLVCLARVLLNKRRILVLDEATASVDTATDNVIQKTLREETSNCTVITVAHRIPTVIDNDLVLVLDEGNIVEYDSPMELLKDNSSAFSKLVMEFLRRSSRSSHHMSTNQ